MRVGPSLLLLTLLGPAPVGAVELFATTRIEAQAIQFWHDASNVAPWLGNPTSVLTYPQLVAPTLTLGLSEEIGDWTVQGSVTVAAVGWGEFRDTDYLAGGFASSDTLSRGALDGALSGQIKAYPGVEWAVSNDVTLRPFGTIGVGRTWLSAHGLNCGVVCVSPVLADSVEVMRHVLSSGQAGIGIEGDMAVGTAGRFTLAAQGLAGGLAIDDSHVLRPDLGPLPNIVYRYATLGADLTAKYEHALSPTLSAHVEAGAGAERGWGTATFTASTASPLTFDAAFQRVRAHFGLGLQGSF